MHRLLLVAVVATDPLAIVTGLFADAHPEFLRILQGALRTYDLTRLERANFIQAESAAKAARLEGKDAPNYDKSKRRNEESLCLLTYDVETVPLTFLEDPP